MVSRAGMAQSLLRSLMGEQSALPGLRAQFSTSRDSPLRRRGRRRGIVDDDQRGDPSVPDREVAGQDQLVGKVGLVVLAVVAAAEDRLSVVLDHVGWLDRDVVADDL